MTAILFVVLIVGATALLSWPLGRYMKWAMDPGEGAGTGRQKLDRLFEAIAGKLGREQQGWKKYVVAMLAFNVVMFVVTFSFMAFQQHLPLNPDGMKALTGDLIFNTAASFTSNTNLQHYSGEASMSYLSQLGGLMWLQFVSAATGVAALAALARGLSGKKELGNFFVDVQRASFLVFLPVAVVVALLFVAGGMPMTFHGAAHATTLEGAQQIIARGPVAAFVAIKQLGTNGGGFFGPNCTHPLENPSFWTNAVAMISIILIPMACVWMFGRIVGRMKHATVIFAVMMLLLLVKIGGAVWFEQAPTQAFAHLPIDHLTANLEGKELRLGATTGPLWAVITTATSNGSVGAMHDSLNPMTGVFPMIGMWLNATFGGVGVGMINMFIYIILAVFISGMMVGRTPEYLNRRVEAREVKLGDGRAAGARVLHPRGDRHLRRVALGDRPRSTTPDPHGFSEMLYEFSSASANNGSGFEGLGDNTVPWNVATGIMMLLARFIPIILPLAIAGSLASKKATAQSAGTLGVQDATFGVMLTATIIVVGALTFFPAAALGPIAEHLKFML